MTSAVEATKAIPEDVMKVASNIVTDICVKRGQMIGFHASENEYLELAIARAILAERVNERVRMGMHVDRMVREAVEAERERCARVAKKWKGHPADFHFAGRQIATAIQEPQI